MTPTRAQALPSPLRFLAGVEIGDIAMPVGVLAIVIALITPLPGFVLDLLIVLDIMMSVAVMMVAMHIRRPAEFSVFPTILLLLTLFRLALNVSSSRLILLNGNMGTSAAGHVIEAFGSFVVGGNYVIGAVIFIMLNAIQYVVINHGAVRISEVTARFTLDALPGKQMSIDADLNAGMIDENESRRRRKELAAEAEFYGAMDGASRFTQRDAVASILITSINIVAGFLIGVLQHGMDLRRALETYTVLTIGDGLVTVIPALVISISGGLIVTQANSDLRVGAQVHRQMFASAQPLLLAGGVTSALAAFPGLPAIPFLIMGAGLSYAGWKLRGKTEAGKEASLQAPAKAAKENLEGMLHVEPLAIEVGLGLVSMVEGSADSPLLQRVAAIRKQLASQLGYILPTVKVNDNLSLRSREYIVLLKGAEIARFELPQGRELAIPSGPADPSVEGKATVDPAFGLPAVWVRPDAADLARQKGYTVVDAVSVLGTHFAELIRHYAHELFTRQDAKNFCDRIAKDHPKTVEDLVPKLISYSVVHKVLQNLLRERVSIRDGVTILEALAEGAVMTKNVVLLTEYVRQAIRRTLLRPHLSGRNELTAYLLGGQIEQSVEAAIEHGEHNSVLTLAPGVLRDITGRIAQRPEKMGNSVLVTSGGCRYFIRQMLEAALPGLTVLSHGEIPPEVTVRSFGVVE